MKQFSPKGTIERDCFAVSIAPVVQVRRAHHFPEKPGLRRCPPVVAWLSTWSSDSYGIVCTATSVLMIAWRTLVGTDFMMTKANGRPSAKRRPVICADANTPPRCREFGRQAVPFGTVRNAM